MPRVLLVDDEPEILDFYESCLGSDYELRSVSDGTEAVEAVRAERFDVIVSDISMPGMTGLQLLRLIRETDLDVPVILITGDPSVDTAIEAVEYGALRYLTKPVKPADLRKVVLYGFRLHEMARAKREAYRLVSGDGGMAADRAGLETRFDAALESLWLAFQPIVDWNDRRLFGYECLVRTNESSLANPLAMLEAAERLHRVNELGRAIRGRAADACRDLRDDKVVFVNLHHLDLYDDHLFDTNAPLSSHAKSVVLEVTERKSLDAVANARTRIQDLRAMGYRIAMDDLGAGHNGLHTFAQLEPDIVKLDMLLVRGADTQGTRLKVIKSMADLCRELKIDFITEGVETEAERDALVSVGCNLLQGYLFGAPDRIMQKPFN